MQKQTSMAMCSASCMKDIETWWVVKLDMAAELCLKVHFFHMEHSTIQAQKLMTSSLTALLEILWNRVACVECIQDYSQLVVPESYC